MEAVDAGVLPLLENYPEGFRFEGLGLRVEADLDPPEGFPVIEEQKQLGRLGCRVRGQNLYGHRLVVVENFFLFAAEH